MKVRDLMVRLGVQADTQQVVQFDAAVANAKRELQRIVDQTIRSASAMDRLSGAMHGPLTQSQDLAQRMTALGRQVSAAGARFSDAQGQLGTLRDRLGEVARAGTAAVAAIVGLTGVAVANATAVGADSKEIEEQAKALGYTVEQYQELRTVLGDVGIDGSNMADLLNTISEHAQAAANGSKEMAATYKLIGVNADDLKNKHPQEVLERIADGLTHATNEQKRLAFASGQFGDDLSRHVVPVLQKGAAGLRDMMEQAKRTGGVLSAEAVKASAAFAREAGLLTRRLTGLRREAGAALAPALLAITKRMNAWLDANRALIRSGIDAWMKRVGLLLEMASHGAEALDRAIKHLGGYERVLTATAAAVGALAAGFVLFKAGGAAYAGAMALGEILLGIAGLLGVGGAFAGVPAILVGLAAIGAFVVFLPALLLVGSAFAALFLAVDDLITAIRGGDSLIGRFVAAWQETPGLLGAVARQASYSVAVLRDLSAILYDLGVIGVRLSGEVLSALATGLGNLFGVADVNLGVLDALDAGLTGLLDTFNALLWVFDLALKKFDGFLGRVESGGPILAQLRSAFGFGGDIVGEIGATLSAGLAPDPLASSPVARTSTSVYNGGTYTVNAGALSGSELTAHTMAMRESELRAARATLVGGDE